MENRRKHLRNETSFEVKYYPEGMENQFAYSISNNVSKGGLSMPAVSKIAKTGDVIRMEMTRGAGGDRILASGKVKWVNMRKRKALLDEEIGVEFTDILPSDIDRLIGTHL